MLYRLRAANQQRQRYWRVPRHPSSYLFRCVEFAGEAGEVADAVKKLARLRMGILSSLTEEEAMNQIKEEVADALISLDLLCENLGIDLAECVPPKFNATSEKMGIPVYMQQDWSVSE